KLIIVFCTKKRLFIRFQKLFHAYLYNVACSAVGAVFRRAHFPVICAFFACPDQLLTQIPVFCALFACPTLLLTQNPAFCALCR
ncbi:MAG: hypothetical protein II676_06940, partial [Bacteroidales bacterium]|nr:hypothetical protein [Bacteroidales bacterium]